MTDSLTEKVKCAVLNLVSDAEIILYGSRSRNEASPDSDWDFLVLTDSQVDDDLTDKIRHQLYEIEWDTGEVLSVIVRNRTDWNSNPLMATPFHRNVELDGLTL